MLGEISGIVTGLFANVTADFGKTPKIGHDETKQPVTFARNGQSRSDEMSGHDGPKYAQSNEAEAFPGHGRQSAEQEEIARLRKENRELRMERDILKKRRPSSPKKRVEIWIYLAGEEGLSSDRIVSCHGSQS